MLLRKGKKISDTRSKNQVSLIFFVSQSRLTDAVSVIFGELLSYEHPPKAGGYFLAYTVPVTVSTAVPGVTLYAPVAASWVKVAAGTVMTPGTVANTPVAAS